MYLEKSSVARRNMGMRKRGRKGRLPRVLLTILMALVFLFAAISFGVSYYIVSQMAGHRVEKLEATPEELGLPGETVSVTSKDGIPLKAWLVPHESAKAIVIVLHGMDGIDASSMLGHSKFLYEAGYTSIALDMRAHGRSGGDTISFAYKEPSDVIAVLDWIGEKEEYRGLPVTLLGLSMGGATAIRTAAARDDVDAVISVSSYASIEEMSADFMKMQGMPETLTDVMMPFMKMAYAVKFGVLPSKSSPVHDIAKISPRPIMIAHGTADGQTALKHAYKLRDAAGDKAEIWLEDGADHCIFKGDGSGPEDKFYRDRVLEFLERVR